MATSTADEIATTAPTRSAAASGQVLRRTSAKLAIDRHAERDRRRPEQEMHELRAVEIGLVVRAGKLEQSAKEGDGDQDVIDDRVGGVPALANASATKKAASVAVSQKSGVACR